MNLQICTTTGDDLLLRAVSTYLVDDEVLRVLFTDGRQHNYPLINVRWYGPETPLLQGYGVERCTCERCDFERQSILSPRARPPKGTDHVNS